MVRLIVGSLAAAAAMFFLGFLIYGTPLFAAAYKVASFDSQMVVQESLRGLPGSGTYFIPMGTDAAAEAAHGQGPRAMVKVRMEGSPMMNPMVMVQGFIHMALSALLLGLFLLRFSGRVTSFTERMALVAYASLAIVFFVRLGEPVWFLGDWRFTLFTAVADFVTLLLAGFILARWFMPKSAS